MKAADNFFKFPPTHFMHRLRCRQQQVLCPKSPGQATDSRKSSTPTARPEKKRRCKLSATTQESNKIRRNCRRQRLLPGPGPVTAQRRLLSVDSATTRGNTRVTPRGIRTRLLVGHLAVEVTTRDIRMPRRRHRR